MGKDENDEDLFGIEVTGDNVLHNLIENYQNMNDDERYDRSKTSIGKVYRYENDIFISTGHHFFDCKVKNDKISNLVQFVYIGEIYRYSTRNYKYRKHYSEDGGYIAKRNLFSRATVYQKYLILLKSVNKEIAGIECSKIVVRIQDNIDYWGGLLNDDIEQYKNSLSNIEER